MSELLFVVVSELLIYFYHPFVFCRTSYCMFTIPANLIDRTGRVLYTIFGEGQQMEGDVMDYLINLWKDKPETSEIFTSADRVVLSPYFIQVLVLCTPISLFCSSFGVVAFGRCFNSVFVNAQYCLEYDFYAATVPKFDAEKSAGLLPMFVRKEEDLLNANLVSFS